MRAQDAGRSIVVPKGWVTHVIEYRESHDVDLVALGLLRAACEFAAKDHEFLAQQVAGARWVVHAYDCARLVGFCRALSDGVSSA